MSDSFLTRHLHEADERYFSHMAFTIKAAAMMFAAGFAVLIHGVVPCLCIHTGSTLINKLHAEMQARKIACEERSRLKDR